MGKVKEHILNAETAKYVVTGGHDLERAVSERPLQLQRFFRRRGHPLLDVGSFSENDRHRLRVNGSDDVVCVSG